ncbi:MAG: radical SAM protein [Oscillospiraceae bacterium]|jgi:organic radical activating enzyme|nr:radical SAM protein [Oscillospiraceae bacterium]
MNEQSLLVIRRGMNASQDGPGNRLVYHLQGCNFRCRWCSNPESIPLQGLTLQTEPPRCSCRAISVAALAKEALAARPLFFGGGGVTFTGGEPTTQFKALKTALELCRANGIHTCLESNASHPRLPELFALIDFLILDCKHYDNQAHLHWTGQGNATVCENLRRAAGEREQLLLRIPWSAASMPKHGTRSAFPRTSRPWAWNASLWRYCAIMNLAKKNGSNAAGRIRWKILPFPMPPLPPFAPHCKAMALA